MDMIFAVLALGLFGLLLVGAILAIANAVRIGRLERSNAALAARVARLEADSGLEAEPGARVEPVPGAPPAARPAAEPAAKAASAPRPAPQAKPRLDLESLIAGRWLNRVGILAVMVGVAFFLKFAFDNDWVGPAGRVAIGLVTGAGLMVGSQWLHGRGYRYFSEGMAALGGGVIFLSLFAAWDFYELIPQWAAFTGMVLVTAALAGLATGRGSQRLAALALGAGLTAPGLLSTGTDQQVTLFTYLAILVGCFLVLAWRRGWRWLAPIALAGVVFYFVGWYDRFYTDEKLVRTALFATLFFGEMAAYLVLRARDLAASPESKLRNLELLLVPTNAAWYGLVLHHMLYREHRWWLTVAALALAALHLVAARFTTPRARPDGQEAPVSAAGLVLAGLAFTFATAAIPIRLQGEWITIAWALEAALLVWAGFRAGVWQLRAAGAALLAVVVILLLVASETPDRAFLNQRFASFAAVVAALAVSAWWARGRWREISPLERLVWSTAGVVTNVVAVWGVSEEVWRLLGRQRWDLDPRLARQMGLSLLWAVAASAFILVGVRLRSKALRWQGLVLLVLTVGKVFLLDLSFLERAYRIASFLVLGVVLLVVSFWYQKSLGTEEPEEEDRA